MEDLGQWYTTKEPNHLNMHNDDLNNDEEVIGIVNMLDDDDDVNIEKCTIKCGEEYATII